jgi:hypothetical protein
MSDESSVSTETEVEPEATAPPTAAVTVFIPEEAQSIIDAAIEDCADESLKTADEVLAAEGKLAYSWHRPRDRVCLSINFRHG